MQSVSNFLQKGIIIADTVVDYVPFYSIRNNVICLIAKMILYGMERYTPSLYTKLQDSHLVIHLNQKGVGECIMLCIPFFNIFVALVRDFPGCIDSLTGPSEAQREVEREIEEFEVKVKKEIEETRTQLNEVLIKGQTNYEAAKKKAQDDFASHLKEYEDKLSTLPDDLNNWYQREITVRCIELLKTHHKGELELLKTLYGVK